MTKVGKILVFFNLVFSMVVGAFAVLDYTARTHWVTKYKELGRITLFIAGHTDSVGNEGYNLQLSQRRAQSIGSWFRQPSSSKTSPSTARADRPSTSARCRPA